MFLYSACDITKYKVKIFTADRKATYFQYGWFLLNTCSNKYTAIHEINIKIFNDYIKDIPFVLLFSNIKYTG